MNVNVGSIGSPYVALLRLRTAANGNIVRVFVNGTGLLWIKSDVSGQQISSSTVIGTGWHNVELCGGSGTWHLYRDGTPIVGTWTANTGRRRSVASRSATPLLERSRSTTTMWWSIKHPVTGGSSFACGH